MLFRAENLGPIRDAELDLSKRLIILAGPNNSGKTYLGWALYGLSRFSRPVPCVRALVDAAIANSTGVHSTGPFKGFIAEFASELCSLYAKHIYRDFAASPSTFAATILTLVPGAPSFPRVSFASDDGERFVGIDLQEHEGTLRVRLWARRSGKSTTLRPSSGTRLDAGGTPEDIPVSSFPPDVLQRIASQTSTAITRALSRELFGAAFMIFPVERIATTIFAQELLLRRARMFEEEGADEPGQPAAVESRTGRYPLPIRDSLLVAADLSLSGRQASDFFDLADELESSVLQGRFMVGEHGDMLFVPDASPQHALGLHQSASIVKSLSSLVFYFRHLAYHGNHIIIDEPELNLHPDNQRKVARVLAKAANRGIRIMLSTHSDYLIGEFNNLLMLSRDTPQAAAVRDELGYDAASVLRPEDVGVYLVNDGLCLPVEVKQTGFELKTFEDAFHNMNRDAQTIYNRIFAE
jgi:hypothetical protein